VQFSTFAEFVTTPPLEGLGVTLDQLRGICRSDPEALDTMDRATQNAVGTNQHVDNVNTLTERSTGNTPTPSLIRLVTCCARANRSSPFPFGTSFTQKVW